MSNPAHIPAWVRVAPGMVAFEVGQPRRDLLPTEKIAAAAQHRFQECRESRFDDRLIMQYGESLGEPLFRSTLASFLTQEYGHQVDADNLFVTNGSTHGLDLACACFTNPNDTVFVEDSTYFLALQILRDHRLRVVGVPMDDSGMVVDALERLIIEAQSQAGGRPSLVYTIPSFNNPSGTTLPDDRRRKLAALAEKYSLIIASDDVYQLLHYSGAASKPPPVFPYYTERSLSIGSFSKLIAPGLRLGWLHGHATLLNRVLDLGVTSSGGGFNPLTSGIVLSFIQLGFMREQLDLVRSVCGENLRVLAASLRETLPDCSFFLPSGGYFVWLRLPSPLRCNHLLQLAQDLTEEALAKAATKNAILATGAAQSAVPEFPNGSGVTFSAGHGCSPSGKDHDSYIRICFAYYTAEEIKVGVKRLAMLIEHAKQQAAQ